MYSKAKLILFMGNPFSFHRYWLNTSKEILYCKRKTGGILRILNCALQTGSSPCTMPKQNIHCSAYRLSELWTAAKYITVWTSCIWNQKSMSKSTSAAIESVPVSAYYIALSIVQGLFFSFQKLYLPSSHLPE